MNSRKYFKPARVNPVLVHPEENRVSFDGKWNFCLDPEDKGVKEKWFTGPDTFTEKIAVPGCWQGQGFGDNSKDTIWDFRLEARTFRATYKGTGWYCRTFKVPSEWKDKRLWLNFGGVYPSGQVWLNGIPLGENNLPFVPFGFEITKLVEINRDNLLVVRVHEENRLLGFTYGWQGNWSGLYRSVELSATGPCFIGDFRIYPDVERHTMRLKIKAEDFAPADKQTEIELSVRLIGAAGNPIKKNIKVTSSDVECEIPVPSVKLWSPDTPNLYRVDAKLKNRDIVLDAQSERTGFVKLSTKGRQFRINNEPYYMRGSGDFLSCPETGCPDTDRERWRKKLRALRDYGYNYVRCQSYVYGPEYYDVADEVGLLVQSEMGMLGAFGGLTIWHVYSWPRPTPDYFSLLKEQWDTIVLRDVNHPSANLYCMSNELGTDTCFPRTAWQCYKATKAIKPTAFVIWTDGGYNENLPGDFVNSNAVDNSSGTSSKDLPKYKKSGKPVIQHEFAWWSAFPDVRIEKKYSGAVRHYSAEIAKKAAERQGLKRLLPSFAANSQKLQFLEAKAKMENCRRDVPWLAGISHFNAQDAIPSPQGIIDEFYEKKITAPQVWLQTNGDTVILADLGFDDRVKSSQETFKCRFLVSDFSHPPMLTPEFKWQLTDNGKTLSSGRIAYTHRPYCTSPIGGIDIVIPSVSSPVAAKLEASLIERNRTISNSWRLWLFPAKISMPGNAVRYGTFRHTWLKGWHEIKPVSKESLAGKNVILTEQIDENLMEFMQSGGRVILAAGEGLVRPHSPLFNYVKYFFTPPANYAPYEDGQNGTIIQNHPMLGNFPHAGFADFQFFRMMEESPPIDLAPLGLEKGDPVIRVIHRYPVCHPLGYIVERSFGKGGIIIISLNLSPEFIESHFLLAQICMYADSRRFRPELSISKKTLQFLTNS